MQNRAQMDRQIAAGGDVTRFISGKGIYGRGAVSVRALLAQYFAGMSPEEAVAMGPDAWLAAEVSEDVARRIFGDEVAAEAKRRTQARSNSKK